MTGKTEEQKETLVHLIKKAYTEDKSVLAFIIVFSIMFVTAPVFIWGHHQKEIDFENKLASNYGENATVEDTSTINYKDKTATRYIITVASDKKPLEKGFVVLLDDNKKVINEQQLTDEQLTAFILNKKKE